ncbi:hypothetical protein LTR74_002878 [Friedmanniomyces endolithicus]|nr:hypothetical protein LTR74_002878 [Friedmanniomyces endolithicus]
MAGLNQAFIVLVLRFVQGILALIVLGLTAYVSGGSQTISLVFTNITAVEDFNGTEIGGCSQGN